jgi:hypothetical protein
MPESIGLSMVVITSPARICRRRPARFYATAFGCALVPPERDFQGKELDAGTGLKGAHLRGAHYRLPGDGDQDQPWSLNRLHPLPQRIVQPIDLAASAQPSSSVISRIGHKPRLALVGKNGKQGFIEVPSSRLGKRRRRSGCGRDRDDVRLDPELPVIAGHSIRIMARLAFGLNPGDQGPLFTPFSHSSNRQESSRPC